MARHDRAGDRAKTGATYLSLIVACLIALVPLVVIVMASFKTGTEFNQGQVLDAAEGLAQLRQLPTRVRSKARCSRPSSTPRSSWSCRSRAPC